LKLQRTLEQSKKRLDRSSERDERDTMMSAIGTKQTWGSAPHMSASDQSGHWRRS